MRDISDKVISGQCAVTTMQAGVDCNVSDPSKTGYITSIVNIVLASIVLILVMALIVTHSHPHK
jgi:hypothetical protein